MQQDKQLRSIKLKDVMEKRRLDWALNAKEFAVAMPGIISYSTATGVVSATWFSRISRRDLLAGFRPGGAHKSPLVLSRFLRSPPVMAMMLSLPRTSPCHVPRKSMLQTI